MFSVAGQILWEVAQNLLPLQADFTGLQTGPCRVTADHKKQSWEGGEPDIHKEQNALKFQEQKWPGK